MLRLGSGTKATRLGVRKTTWCGLKCLFWTPQTRGRHQCARFCRQKMEWSWFTMRNHHCWKSSHVVLKNIQRCNKCWNADSTSIRQQRHTPHYVWCQYGTFWTHKLGCISGLQKRLTANIILFMWLTLSKLRLKHGTHFELLMYLPSLPEKISLLGDGLHMRT